MFYDIQAHQKVFVWFLNEHMLAMEVETVNRILPSLPTNKTISSIFKNLYITSGDDEKIKDSFAYLVAYLEAYVRMEAVKDGVAVAIAELMGACEYEIDETKRAQKKKRTQETLLPETTSLWDMAMAVMLPDFSDADLNVFD